MRGEGYRGGGGRAKGTEVGERGYEQSRGRGEGVGMIRLLRVKAISIEINVPSCCLCCLYHFAPIPTQNVHYINVSETDTE